MYRTLGIVGAVLIGVVGVASAQARPAPAGGAPMDELLVEVRGLRAELNQAAGTSIRAQLLVARLQLQEQRINSVARQLAEVQERVASMETGLLRMAGQLKSMLEATGMPPEQLREMEQARIRVKAEIDLQRNRQQELRSQEASLSTQLAEAQSRWSEFNDRLDELERMLPARPR